MENNGSVTIAVNDFINSLYAYKNISLYDANHVFDEEKSVRWNREEVERLNNSYDNRLSEAYTQARSEAAALSARIATGNNSEKTLSQTAQDIIQDDLLDELLKISDDLSSSDNSLERRTYAIVNKYLQFVKLILAIEDKNKQEQTISGEKWLDIRAPFSFHHKDVLYSNIFTAIAAVKYGISFGEDASGIESTATAAKTNAYIRKNKLKQVEDWDKQREEQITAIFGSALGEGLYEELLATDKKKILAADKNIGEYGSILMAIREKAQESMIADFLSKQDPTKLKK